MSKIPDEPATLAEFLAARLDEREAAAEAVAALAGSPDWHTAERYDGGAVLLLTADGAELGGYRDAFAAHIALHDPSRVLREVEAGRKLLARWHEADSRRLVSAEDEARAWLLDGLLADRAAVWSGHGEFDKRWLT